MVQNDPQPWNPERSWANPLIAMLVLLILLLIAGQPRFRKAHPALPDAQVTLEGKFQDAFLGAAKAKELGALKGLHLPGTSIPALASGGRTGWDQAMLAVHAAEAGDLDTGGQLIQGAPGPTGELFRQSWNWCYRNAGSPPGLEFQAVGKALGNGYAARVLEARLRAKAGGDPKPLEDQARTWALARILVLGAAGAAATLLGLAGLAFALYLGLTPARPVALPHFGLSGRALLIVMLGWFLALLASGPLVAALVGAAPFLKPFYLPMVYSFHALLGAAYLSRAEGITLGALWRKVAPGPPGTALAMGLGFFALAFAGVVAVSMILSPLLHNGAQPQKELLELLTHLEGPLAVILLFITVAVLAPVFEELLFRGFLLSWLSERLGARIGLQRGRHLAVAITAVSFAVMHMQPLGLPTLTTLGIVLGFAFLRTGNLTTAILVHGFWNGSVFILMRAIAG